MQTFDQYWLDNQAKYMEKAKEDFARLSQGAYYANVDINTDDDFDLDIDYNFNVYGMNDNEVREKLIATLLKVVVTRGSAWSYTRNGETISGNKADLWTEMRDYAIELIKDGQAYIDFGGNQTMTINFGENKVI